MHRLAIQSNVYLSTSAVYLDIANTCNIASTRLYISVSTCKGANVIIASNVIIYTADNS